MLAHILVDPEAFVATLRLIWKPAAIVKNLAKLLLLLQHATFSDVLRDTIGGDNYATLVDEVRARKQQMDHERNQAGKKKQDEGLAVPRVRMSASAADADADADDEEAPTPTPALRAGGASGGKERDRPIPPPPLGGGGGRLITLDDESVSDVASACNEGTSTCERCAPEAPLAGGCGDDAVAGSDCPRRGCASGTSGFSSGDDDPKALLVELITDMKAHSLRVASAIKFFLPPFHEGRVPRGALLNLMSLMSEADATLDNVSLWCEGFLT
jgi:hypothetical protein